MTGLWVWLFAGLLAAPVAFAGECPPSGAEIEIRLDPAPTARPSTALVFGTLDTPSCVADDHRLERGYAVRLDCDRAFPEHCRARLNGLRPGQWTHRILVTLGEATGQFQGRKSLLLDASAGSSSVVWPLYRSVHTVLGLGDALGCVGCLRDAITNANAAPKPALVQFTPDVLGSVVLAAQLSPLATGRITVDGFDTDGVPLTRTIDANGMNVAALRITSAQNRVVGLRIVNSGGDSDTLLIDGSEANGNVIEDVEVVGRTQQTCEIDSVIGCIIDGACRVPGAQFPRGDCGDDSIAVRNFAGAADPNVIRRVRVSGARDKGIKVSDGGAAIVERSIATGNADGGLQATLSGRLTAIENTVISNRGTNSASGLAANGASLDGLQPGRLDTRGNLSVDNALRGVSVRSLSVANLQDDFICGNGTPGRGGGFGVAVLDAAGRSALTNASGIAVVHNVDGGVVLADSSTGNFGSPAMPGDNAFAFNGPDLPASPANFRNQTALAVNAGGNQWEHCGVGVPCNREAVQQMDVFATETGAPVSVDPIQPTRRREAPRITAIEPAFAAAGELVRIYGTGFDAINGTGPDATCADLGAVNSCNPVRGNCVFIGREAAEVVAVTPTMLVVKVPTTCVEPLPVRVRTRWSRGFARATFCTHAPAAG